MLYVRYRSLFIYIYLYAADHVNVTFYLTWVASLSLISQLFPFMKYMIVRLDFEVVAFHYLWVHVIAFQITCL